MSKASIVKKSLRDQLKKCQESSFEEVRRYERGILMGMLQAYRITNDIEPCIENYYLEKMIEMIDEESEV